MAITKSGERNTSLSSVRPSDVCWPAVRSVTVVRLVGKAVHLAAPRGGHIIYQPALVDTNSPVEQAVADVDLANDAGSQQLSSLVALASSVYAHLGVVDHHGRVLTTVPVSLGVVLTHIKYWPRSERRGGLK